MIEVNEYVRTDEGEIAKVTSVAKETLGETLGIDEYRDIGFCNTEPYVKGKIVKHSKQLIDLIEVRDIVHVKGLLYEDMVYMFSEESLKNLKVDIESGIEIVEILAHEQFEQNSYKVGGEDECM